MISESSIKQEEKQELIRIFGDRAAFSEIERMLYSADLTTLPDFVKRQIHTVPDAVVQPNSSAD